jgi:arylsulfatase A-like enzyme
VEWAAEDRAVVTNRYDNAIAYVDEQVGKLVARLEVASQLHDTILIVTSDHGELFGEHDLVTHGRSLYDAEARVPMLVHWPKRVRPGDAYEPVSHLDVLPSVLDLMDVPAHPAFQGKSFVSARAELDQPTGVYLNIQGQRAPTRWCAGRGS